MDTQNIIVLKDDSIALVQLNRISSANALSTEFRKEIYQRLNELESDSAIKVVIITGTNNIFCAGFDLKEFLSVDLANVPYLIESSEELFSKIIFYKKPIIAAINGPALAGGMDIAIACDIRIASEKAIFGAPEIKFVPATYGPYAHILGEGRARELILTGKILTAKDALEIGLINKLTTPDKLIEESIIIAKTIAEAPLHVLQLEKKVIIDLQGKNMVETVDIENKLFREILYDKQKLDDFKKSLKNYIDKLKIKI